MPDHAQLTADSPAQETADERRDMAPGVAPVGPLTPARVLAMQRAAGNSAVKQALAASGSATGNGPVLARNGKGATKAPPKQTKGFFDLEWAEPGKGEVEELLGWLDTSLRDAPTDVTNSGVWVHMVLTPGRIHVFDTDLKPVGTFRLVSNARTPADGYYMSALGPVKVGEKPGKAEPGKDPVMVPVYQHRWVSLRLAFNEDSSTVWVPQGFGSKKDKSDLMLDDWIVESEKKAFAAAVGPATRLGLIVSGFGGKGAADKARDKVNRVRKLLDKARKKGKGESEGDKKGENLTPQPKDSKDPKAPPKDPKDPSDPKSTDPKDPKEKKDPNAKGPPTDKPTDPNAPKPETPADPDAKSLPDTVAIVEDRKGIHIQITVDGARQNIPYNDKESDEKTLERIKKATEKVREEIDPSKSVRIEHGAEETKVSDKPGTGGVPLPDGFKPTPGARAANTPGYPAEIISHGPGGKSGHETTVLGATMNFTMELDYHAHSFGTLDEVTNRMQPIAYRWELIKIDGIEPDKLKEHLKTATGKKTDSGITQDLVRDLSNTWEDTKEDLKDVQKNPALAPWLQVVAISDLVQVGGALISAYFSLISQPLNERSIGFNEKGQYVLRCFAQPVFDEDYVAKIEARGDRPVIRAPSSAIYSITVGEINQRAEDANNEDLAKIAALEKQLDKPPFPFEREDVEKALKAAREGLEDNHITAVDRQIKGIDDELKRIRDWQHVVEVDPALQSVGDELMMWKAMLDFQGTELGPYEKQLNDLRKQLETARKRYAGFGLKGTVAAGKDSTKGLVFRPRITLASEVNGQVTPVVANLAETTWSKEGKRVWRLIDVTSAETQDIYEGVGDTHNAAIRDAFNRFRDNNGYGRGSLAIRLPLAQLKAYTGEDVAVDSIMRSRPGSEARALQRLQDLATAAEIASLVVTGPVGMAIGAVGALAGGYVAIQNMRRRAAADRLKADFQTGMDILGVVGAVVAVGGITATGAQKLGAAGSKWAKAAEMAKTDQAFQTLIKRARWSGDMLHIAGQGMMKGQWIVIAASTYHELREIEEAEEKERAAGGNPSPQKYRAKKLMALAKGIKSGFVQIRSMQMASGLAGWDPLAESSKPRGKGVKGWTPDTPEPPKPSPIEAGTLPKPVEKPVVIEKPGGGGGKSGPAVDVTPPVKPPSDGPPSGGASGKRPPSGADEPTIAAPERPKPVVPDKFKGWVKEAFKGIEPTAKRIQFVDGTLLQMMMERPGLEARNRPKVPKDVVAVADPDTGMLFVDRAKWTPELHAQAYEAVVQGMNSRGRAALSEPVARAVAEVALQGALPGQAPFEGATPQGRALHQRLQEVLGPDGVNRVAFNGEVNLLGAKLAERFGAAHGNAIEAALKQGNRRLANRLLNDPSPAMSNTFGELLAIATADMIARGAGGKPRRADRAALAERISNIVGKDIVEAAFYEGRVGPLKEALTALIGPEGMVKLTEALRSGNVKAAAKLVGAEGGPWRYRPKRTGPEPPPKQVEKPVQDGQTPVPKEPVPQGDPNPSQPVKQEVAPVGPKGRELSGSIEQGAKTADLHELALDTIAEGGNFKELRNQVREKGFGNIPEAQLIDALQTARIKLVDGVLAEIIKVIEAKYPDVKLKPSDLGTPGFGSDRDVTIKGRSKPGQQAKTNDLVAASVEAVQAAYDVLNGRKPPPGAADPFENARKLVGDRKFPPDKVLDSNFYTELHEGSIKPRTVEERLGIVEDQSVVSLAEVRANVHDIGEWTAYKERLLKSFDDSPGAGAHEQGLNKAARERVRGQLEKAEKLHAELHPPGTTSEAMLAQVQQQLLDAIKAGASPRRLRDLQARIKLLEPDAYGTRAAVVGVVDQSQGAARAETRQKAWEALNTGKEPMSVRESAATSAQEAAASAGKLRHAAPDVNATTSQCIAAAKYLGRIWEAFRKAGLNMDHPLLDRAGDIVGAKQEPKSADAAMTELKRWAQDQNMLGLTEQQIRDAFVKEVKRLGEQLDVRLRHNEAIRATLDPSPAEIAAMKNPTPPSDGGGPGGGPGGGKPTKTTLTDPKSSDGPPPPPKKEPPPKAPAPQGPAKTPPPSKPKPGNFDSAEAFASKAVELLSKLEHGMDNLPANYHKAMEALAKSKNPVNKKVAKLLPIVEAGLRNPELYRHVLTDAWNYAITNGTDLPGAIVGMAREAGLTMKTIKPKQGLLDADEFFQEHATSPKGTIDKGAPAEHGTYTHLLQELVVERALRAAKRNETAAEFRQMLKRVEGWHGRVNGKGGIPLGDLVWRVTYDTEAQGHISDPETLKTTLEPLGMR